jgi:hypothetical protein
MDGRPSRQGQGTVAVVFKGSTNAGSGEFVEIDPVVYKYSNCLK